MTNTKFDWLASCPKGLEQLLAKELDELGASDIRETVAGVSCRASLESAYRICLWSRLANRLLLQLDHSLVSDDESLYQGAKNVDWSRYIGSGKRGSEKSGSGKAGSEKTIAVRFSGGNKHITHTQYGARRVKDAIVDHFREQGLPRPNVDTRNPDIWIQAHLASIKGGKSRLHLALDFSGDSLHRRRYRAANTAAPLKENLAAALLLRANWPQVAEAGGALIDPMCGSGTLLIEAALMALDVAPGLLREEAGDVPAFTHWPDHNDNQWQLLLAEARQRRQNGRDKAIPEIRGYDVDGRTIRAAEENIQQAGLAEWVRVSPKPLKELKQPTHKTLAPGLVITNPPYGERLGEQEALRDLYHLLGERLKSQFPGWQAAVFTGNPELGPEMNLRAHKQYRLFNGAIPCKLLLFAVNQQSLAASEPTEPEALSEGAKMFANRITKNQRKLKSWLKRENIHCYRLYDADMPEYAVAVDIYRTEQGEAVHLQEYDPPKTIDPRDARRRLREARQGLQEALQLGEGELFFKQRKRQKGSDQYQRQNAESADNQAVRTVAEGAAKLEVNLKDYLDTGLFLDHRPLRRLVHQKAAGKSLLNLFCYTASISVQAALGGASRSLSVDMSPTYLDWARRNFELNGLDLNKHQLERADCLKWLQEASEGDQRYDVIVLDPPTFSNSKKMEGVLDIQRDHGLLIRQCVRLLAAGGELYFSNNFRRFQMDGDVLSFLDVEDITRDTIDPDFQRNSKIHNCWRIKRRGE
ncbi:bifunctional 23S rRNA (guanine(2069)-N(7))-methyltransferase RlmK/23S rRNA (guanine(2445)-N(2))-methyltransferase RlmL [bacterium SCSIO 12696]|nr:bifunctional 23S rRNA (guanine(2069)-N(7))-methyltransferase RlmK/23S rRNA (guanine(2445)-N(2))-methyltransferase RlmL [bacterium SCSIO 12696]